MLEMVIIKHRNTIIAWLFCMSNQRCVSEILVLIQKKRASYYGINGVLKLVVLSM